jgi:hypothetical protein
MKGIAPPPSLVRRLLQPLDDLRRESDDPRRLALAFALGALFGVMPLIWGTTLLCLGAALLLRLNPAALQIANCAVYPLHLALVFPYLRLGEFCLEGYSPVERPLFDATLFGADAPGTLQRLAEANGAALLAWAVTSPLMLIVLYALASFVVKGLDSRCRRAEASRDGLCLDPNQGG